MLNYIEVQMASRKKKDRREQITIIWTQGCQLDWCAPILKETRISHRGGVKYLFVGEANQWCENGMLPPREKKQNDRLIIFDYLLPYVVHNENIEVHVYLLLAILEFILDLIKQYSVSISRNMSFMWICSEDGGHHQNNMATHSIICIHFKTLPLLQIFWALLP